jgi:acetyl-CoA acyltransferase 1
MQSNKDQRRALRRLELIRTQIVPNKCLNSGRVPEKSDDDVVIVAAVRTPMTKSGKGLLKDTQTEVIVRPVLEELLRRGNVKPENIQEIVFGNVLQTGSAFFPTRMAQFLAGFPDTTNVMSVNRLCSSGLQAVMTVAYGIASKQYDIGIGGGVETMSMYDMNNQIDAEKISEDVFNTPKAANCMIPMGITSENVAEQFKIDRKSQDLFAAESQRKALEAQKNGLYDEEIVPVKTKVKDSKGEWKNVTVTKDDGIRETKFDTLQKLKPSFKQGGTTTAGNSSQTTDGAAGVLLMRRSVAKKLGVPVLARILGYSVSGVPPEIMGIGPAYAIPEVLKKTGLKTDDIDIFEINEAFASQATYCARVLNIPAEKINPKGGAIALGHPLGMTGARQFATLLPELKRQNKRFGIISMCIGTGMGAACVVERE